MERKVLMRTVHGQDYRISGEPTQGDRFWRGTIYPDGEFSFCKQKIFRLNEHTEPRYDSEQREWAAAMVSMHGVRETIQCFEDYDSANGVSLGEQTLVGRLDSSRVANSEKMPAGSKGLTSRGKRIVRNGAYLLETDYGRDRLSFLTLTLPSVSVEGFCSISNNWGSIVELIVKAIRRRLKDAGLPAEVIGVTEIQEKRFISHTCIPLHLHLAFVGRNKKGAWVIRPSHVRKSWRDAVTNYLPGHDKDADFSSSENIQRVRRSCARYLSKYMTKGVESIEKLTTRFPNIRLPKQWYTCTRSLVQRIMNAKIIPDIRICDMLVYAAITGMREIITCVATKKLSYLEGQEFVIAGRGFLTACGRRLIEDLMKEA